MNGERYYRITKFVELRAASKQDSTVEKFSSYKASSLSATSVLGELEFCSLLALFRSTNSPHKSAQNYAAQINRRRAALIVVPPSKLASLSLPLSVSCSKLSHLKSSLKSRFLSRERETETETGRKHQSSCSALYITRATQTHLLVNE